MSANDPKRHYSPTGAASNSIRMFKSPGSELITPVLCLAQFCKRIHPFSIGPSVAKLSQGVQMALSKKKSIRWAAIMADKVVPVSRLLDERGLSAFQIKLLIWSFFIVLID